MSGLLNYTTTIEATKTIAEIQTMLVQAGAKAVIAEFDGARQPCALSFGIATQFGDRAYRLPVNPTAIQAVLVRQFKAGKIQRRFATVEQALRVSWRINKDWLAAQLAIIESGQVSLTRVMLPYMLSASGRTVAELMEDRQLQLPAGATETAEESA